MSANIIERIGQAFRLVQAGALHEAADIVENVLHEAPASFDALQLLGVIRARQGNSAEAIRLFGTAAAVDPASNFAHFNLAKALSDAGREQEALTHHERAVTLAGGHAEAWLNYGRSLRILGRLEAAVAAYGRAVALRPQAVAGWSGRAEALLALRRGDEALADLERALALAPEDADLRGQQARALDRLGRRAEALAAYDRCIALDPGRVSSWAGRGGVLHDLGRYEEACAAYDRALALDPRRAELWSNRGAACNELQRYEEAIASLDRALALNPAAAECWFNRGIARNALRHYEQARDDFTRALALRPDLPYAEGFRLQAKMMVCDWNGLENDWTRLFAQVEAGERAAYPFTLLATPASAALQRRCCEIYLRDHVPARPVPVFERPGQSAGRLRIGYFSADFHRHATAWLLAGVLEQHDRDRLEVIGFSFGPPADDDMRRRTAAACDRFLDVRDRSDAEIAALARGLGVHIAVDLKSVTQGARPGIFAHRAAPIQVNYLGYPGTMAAGYIDYLIADRIVVPPELSPYYAEKIVRLPGSYQPNDNTRVIAERGPTRAEAGLPETGVVFCCFNNTYKITPAVFAIWMRLLAAVPGSVLWLYATTAAAERNLRAEAARRGVAAERLVFAGHLEVSAHLARQRLADLFLDTFYCNAHTTASDALWAGLPVVTCLGETFAGRGAASLLHAAGLPELVARSPAEYEALAGELAASPSRLAALKEKLARNRSTCALFDTAGYTRRLEAAYAAVWRRHCAGLPPADIDIEEG